MAAPDGGWGWVVVAASLAIYIVLGSVERSFGVWYIEILDRYEESSALTEWLIGVHSALRSLFYSVATVLYARVSLRTLGMIGSLIFAGSIFASAFAESFLVLFIVFGVVGGCSSSLLQYIVSMGVVEYFDKKKSLAFGIAYSGSGLGSLLMSPVLSYWFENYSYFETVTFLAAFVLQSLIFCSLFFPVYEMVPNTDEAVALLEYDFHKDSYHDKLENFPLITKKSKDRLRIRKVRGQRTCELDMLLNPVMLLFLISAIATIMGSFSVLQLVVHFAVMRGQTLESASLLLSAAGFVESLCRIVSGVLFNLNCTKGAIVPVWNSCAGIAGICAFLITLCYTFWEFLPTVICYSATFSFVNCFWVLMLTKVFEEDAFGTAFTIYSNGNGFGVLVGTFLAGYMKDASGSYEQSYYIMASLCITGSLINWIVHWIVSRAKKSHAYRLYVSLKG